LSGFSGGVTEGQATKKDEYAWEEVGKQESSGLFDGRPTVRDGGNLSIRGKGV